MKKLLALYRAPSDADAFMAHYRTTHLPLVEKLPGLLRVELTAIDRTMLGEPGNFLLAEMYFADTDTFKVAMKSAENAAASADLANFGEGLATVMAGSVLES